MRAAGETSRARRLAPLVVAVGLVVGAGLAAWWWTGPRMLTVVDSAGYLGAAENLGEGRGLSTPFALSTERASPDQQVAWGDQVPLSEWPPGYPAALAAVSATGPGRTEAARVVSVLGLGVLAGALLAVLRIGTRSSVVAGAGTVLALVGHTADGFLGPGSPLGWSGVIASERLFLPLAVAALAAACWEPTSARARRAREVGAVLLVVGAVSVRYLGVAAAAAVAVAFLLDRGTSRRGRWVRAAVVVAAAGVAALLPGVVAGGAPKVVSWHAVALLDPVVDTMGAWFLVPAGWPLALRAALVVVLVGGPLLWAAGRWARRAAPGAEATVDRMRTGVALAVFEASYLAAVVVTCLLLDAAVPPEQRILAPVQVVAYALLLVAVHDGAAALAARRAPVPAEVGPGVGVGPGAGARSGGWAPWAADGATVLVAVALAWVPVARLGSGHDHLGALGRAQAAALARSPLSGVSPGTVVFTDETSTIWTATGLPTYVLPSRTVVTSARPNQAFDDQVDQVARIVAERDGLVVVYGTGTSARVDDLTGRGLVRIADCDGAAVLARPGSGRAAEVLDDGCTPG